MINIPNDIYIIKHFYQAFLKCVGGMYFAHKGIRQVEKHFLAGR